MEGSDQGEMWVLDDLEVRREKNAGKEKNEKNTNDVVKK